MNKSKSQKLFQNPKNLKQKKDAKELIENYENANLGKYPIKISDNLDIWRTLNAGPEAWYLNPLKREEFFEELLNGHSSGKGFGKSSPVADRL